MKPSLRSATGPGPRDRARLVSLALVLALSWACGPPRQRFRETYASPEALAEVVLGALESGNRALLERLPLSRQEFQLEVFPEMPVYGNVPPDLAWSQIEARNAQGLSIALETQRGRSWELETIDFRRGPTTYQTFTIHRDPVLHLRDRRTGESRVVALFGSLLEHDGRYALVSFNIDR